MSHDSLIEFLSSVEFFSVFSPAELEILATASESHHYDLGDTIFSTGDLVEGLCVIKAGRVRIFTEDHGKEISQGIRKKGDIFAETAATREGPLDVSVRSSGRTEILLIPRAALMPVLKANPAAQRYIARYAAISSAGGMVNRLFDLKGKVSDEVLEEFILGIGIKRVSAGQVVLEQDSRDDHRLYVVHQGKVSLQRTEGGDEFNLASLEKGEIFGEKACLTRQEQQASVIAVTDVVLLVIPEQTVYQIFEHNPKLREVFEDRIQFLDRELLRQKKLAERRNRPLMFDLGTEAKRGERIIKRFPLVPQAEEMDCGAACLAMICKYNKIPMSLGKLRELANVTTEGATMDSLARVGESLGFSTRGVQCTYQSLLGFELPFIAHWEGYHYIIVYGISKSHVWIADPGPGFRKLTVEEFERGWGGTCLLFTPGEQLAPTIAERSPWFRFARYLKPYKKILGHLFLATFIIQMLGVVPPLITQNILDQVIVHKDVPLLNLLIVGLVITTVFSQLTATLRAFLSNYLVRSMDFTMMSMFFKHAMSLPISFFAKRKTGDIFARFQENRTIRAFLTESTVTTILNLLMVFIYFTILFFYNVKLTLLLIAFVVPILLLTVLVTPKLKQYARETFTASTEAEAILMETLGGAETVKGMGIERSMRLKWEAKYSHSLNVQYRAQQFGILVGLGSQLLNAATTIVILWTGANLVLANELSIGQLIAFNALMGSVLTPLMGLVGLWNQVHEAGVAMERLGDVLDMEPEQKPEDMSSRVLLPDLQGDITFENVYFRYGGNETNYVLENISFDIKAGEMVAIVGLSGSGKTTLAKMMVGFYEPTEGKISVDGYDLSLIDREYYRAQIGYVMQSNLLFSGTISDNIAAGEENPDRRRIMEVSQLADAHGFIANMPLGYETVVGERGMGLSGGQMQRLCIARALYHDPRLIIFDEATSALDSQSEGNILNNMQRIISGRTAIVIAHRLSTIMHADKILVLYDGAIVEQGKHQELVDRKGMYYQLVSKQIEGAKDSLG